MDYSTALSCVDRVDHISGCPSQGCRHRIMKFRDGLR
jgi:hypothetical protein